MTGRLRRLVALAVTLAPARASRLMRWLQDPGASGALQLAGELAAAPRRARLAALAAALQVTGSVAPTAPLPLHPLLRRLELERRSRPVAERTLVRAAAAPPPLLP